jgi:hypothetical protein
MVHSILSLLRQFPSVHPAPMERADHIRPQIGCRRRKPHPTIGQNVGALTIRFINHFKWKLYSVLIQLNAGILELLQQKFGGSQ